MWPPARGHRQRTPECRPMAAVPEIDQAIRDAGYRIVGPPIRGGMSTVYPATSDPGVHRAASANEAKSPTVAVKVLHDTADAARLRREAELLASVDHPSIAAFVDVGELSTGDVFLVAQWAPGSTLHSVLVDERQLDTVESLAIFRTIVDGLDHLHDQGIVHRDLSPKNILVDRSGAKPTATLIDFGISRSEASAYQTVGSELAGTPRYLAPEVISGADPSPASDQFSAAIVLHEMLTGSWPYPESPSAANALHHQLSTLPTPLMEVLPDAPPALDHALQRALRKDPAERFPSMAAFLDSALGATVHDAAVARGQTGPPTDRRRVIATIVAALGLVAAGIAFALSRDTDSGASGSPLTTIVAGAPVSETWSAGDARALPCNLLQFTDFDDRILPNNWYLNPIDEAGVDVVGQGGQDDTPAVRVGLGERYGLWGEVVEVEPGVTYLFAGTFARQGSPFVATITIDWYDANNEGLDIESPAVDLTQLDNGRAALRSTAPAEARFGVAQVFKDASEGSLLADELVMVRADDPCAANL